MDRKLEGRVAIVTGASRGIGRGIAHALIAEGARVCITGRNPDPLSAAVIELGGPSVAVGVTGKADAPDHQSETVRRTLDAFGSVDILVNNVGINPAYSDLMSVDLSVTRKTFEVNTFAPLAWTQAVYHAWMQVHGGAVVNVSSLSGVTAAPGLGIYGASKSALEQLTRQLAQELAPTIRVNAVAPAVVKTQFAAKLFEDDEEQTAARFPLRRLGVPADVASAVTYLVSDDASWVTGQVLTIDGGLRLTGGY